jgi:hypothetical protein
MAAMNPDDSLRLSIPHDPTNIERTTERALNELTLDDFHEKVVAIKPNETMATPDD